MPSAAPVHFRTAARTPPDVRLTAALKKQAGNRRVRLAQGLRLTGAVDRPLDPDVTRRQTRRRLAVGGTALSLAVVAYLWLPSLVSPSLRRDAIRTAIVERGPVDATISATGVVVPEIEQVITSPVEARVLRVIERAGAKLAAGQPILQLDISQARLTVDKLSQDLAIKANAQQQKRLSLKKSLIDIEGRADVKALQLASLEAQLQRDRQLSSEGLLSQELLKKSELAAAQAAIELKQLRAERDNAQEATRAELAGLDLEIAKLRGDEVRSAAPAGSRLAPRRSRRRAHVGDHRRGHLGHQGTGAGARRRLRLLPRGRQRLGRPRQAPRRRPAGDDAGRRRATRRHGRRHQPDGGQRRDHGRHRAGRAIQPAAALEPPRGRRDRHGPPAADAARAPRALCHRRRHAAGVRRARRRGSSASR